MARPIFMRVGTDSQIPISVFIDSLSFFVHMLRDVDAAVSRSSEGSVVWELAVLKKESPALVGVVPRQRLDREDTSIIIQEQVIENITLLSSRPERTDLFSDAALANLERLAKKAQRIGPIAIYVEGQESRQAIVAERTLTNVQQLTGARYTAFASIIGSLDLISVHRGNEFRVWDESTNRAIRATFRTEDIDRVKSLLGKRVYVSGIVQSNSAGRPISVSVEEVEAKPKRSTPSIRELSGLVRNLTDGKPLKDYLEELTDE